MMQPTPLKAAILAALCLTGTQTLAQDVIDCDWQASARNLIEPWEDHTRTFSNGATRIAAIDVLEPAAAAFYLLLLSPPYDELGDRQCKLVGMNGMGFALVDITDMTAEYDPATGLGFTLRVQVFESDTPQDRMLHVTLNQATGEITPRLMP